MAARLGKTLAGAGVMLLAGCGGEEGSLPLASSEPLAWGTDGYATAAAFLSCLEGEAALVSAHRGGPADGFPENALSTIDRTLSLVPALIEVDVRETSDGALVLLHDATVDRTTDGRGSLSDMTLEEARNLSLIDRSGRRTDQRIPTLEEAVEMVRGRGILQLDVKRGVSLAKVARAVEEASAGSFTGIITYNARGAYAVGRASGAVSVFATAQDEDELRALSGDGILDGRLVVWTGIHRGLPDERYIRRLDEADIAASGGALGYLDDRAASGDRSAYSRLEGAGIDIIATDRPIEAARELGTEEARAAILSCGAQPPGEAPA